MPTATMTNITGFRDVDSKVRADQSVTHLYAELASSKALWANAAHPLAANYLEAGRKAGDAMIATPARTIEEVVLKLTEALEWISDEASPAAVRLQSEAIRDLKRLAGQPGPVPENQPTGGPARLDKRVREGNARSQPASKSKAPKVETKPAIGKPKGGRRPTTVNGVDYASITAAAQATGIAYHKLRAAIL